MSMCTDTVTPTREVENMTFEAADGILKRISFQGQLQRLQQTPLGYDEH